MATTESLSLYGEDGNLKLSLINYLLSVIGEAPTSDSNDLQGDAAEAWRYALAANRQIQVRGFDFNTMTTTLMFDKTQHIIHWSNSWISVRGADGAKYYKRGSLLADSVGNTIFTENIDVVIVHLIPMSDLPPVFLEWVRAKAAYDYQLSYQGDTALHQKLTSDLQLAMQAVTEYDITSGTDGGNFNIFNFKSYGSFRG